MTNETLEEAAEHNYPNGDIWTEEQAVIRRLAFKNGAKWKAERMFSNEEVIILLQKYRFDLSSGETPTLGDTTKYWFEQFKKK
jgi:hypothetical protein